jgi:hypothetical protein
VVDLPEDRTLILEVLFDVRAGVRHIIDLLEEEDEEAEDDT